MQNYCIIGVKKLCLHYISSKGSLDKLKTVLFVWISSPSPSSCSSINQTSLPSVKRNLGTSCNGGGRGRAVILMEGMLRMRLHPKRSGSSEYFATPIQIATAASEYHLCLEWNLT